MKLLRMGRGVTLGLCIYQFSLGGCVPISERMDTLEATEQKDALIREGQMWLEQASAAELASAEGRRVFLRVAKTRFQLAKQSRSFEALRTFRCQYGLGQGVDDLVAEAKSTEATLYFNERTRPLDAVLA